MQIYEIVLNLATLLTKYSTTVSHSEIHCNSHSDISKDLLEV